MAFSELAKECIAQAIHGETENAEALWGKTYNSNHEGYAVLKEEVEEAGAELSVLVNYLGYSWNKVKHGDNEGLKGNIECIKAHTEKMALEAIQVAAVCNKILNGLQTAGEME